VLGRRILPILFLLLSGVSSAWARDLAVVSNKSNGVQSMALADLVKVCKGETSHWPDGKPVTVIMLDPDAASMKVILQKIYEMKADEVKELITSANRRTDRPAIVLVRSHEEAVARVQSTPGAIGIVDVYSITGGVTVLKIAGKNPFEPGYILHGN
jgi:ABC-type phosphate transport system substrate-binding protein